ncbi:Eco57I restriction-modification methylase domain-containing protein [Erysipelothrix rhusiopathiae]|nr:Eco57I restriction-modification methylase domain-containing protein [Erysipelothrix rhusiopathiae]
MKKYNKYITDNGIDSRNDVIKLIKKNPDNLDLESLSIIAETVNNKRTDTAAFYTDTTILKHIKNQLPIINKKSVRVLEPSVGIGNFLPIIIEKYSHNKELIIDVVDLDSKSLEILKELNKYRDIPKNVKINYFNQNYLEFETSVKYDLVVGNPPFFNLKIDNGLAKYRDKFVDESNKNIAGFFFLNAIKMSRYVFFVMPKYLLHNEEYKNVRFKLKERKIMSILDFGETGFKGVLIETIAILIDNESFPDKTNVVSIQKKFSLIQLQESITCSDYPTWIIYRNKFFDEIANRMIFDVFTVFRDRQITNKILGDRGEIRVLRSRNIKRDGNGILDIPGYDKYTDHDKVIKFSSYKYLQNDEVFLCPNMTYYPRVIKKPKNVLVNGSIAILQLKHYNEIKESQLKYFSTKEFEEFYRIARNHSTRSLNLDKNSIFYFGLIKED